MTMNETGRISEDAAEALTEDDVTRDQEAAAGIRRDPVAALVDATTVLGVLVAHHEVEETTAHEAHAQEAIQGAATVRRGLTAVRRTRVAVAATQDEDLWKGSAATE